MFFQASDYYNLSLLSNFYFFIFLFQGVQGLLAPPTYFKKSCFFTLLVINFYNDRLDQPLSDLEICRTKKLLMILFLKKKM